MRHSRNEYILWGTGLEAEQFYYRYHDKITILYCIDNFNYNRKFHGLQVEHPSSLSGGANGCKILVATSAYFREVKEQLMEMGFAEYRDFDYCFDFDKKIVFINGNCHCRIIRTFLQTSKKFSEQYRFGSWPLINEKLKYDEQALEYCDLFLHQDIREENSAGYRYSDEYILPKLRQDCIKCCIPNLYGFPKALFYKNYMKNEKGYNIGKIDNPFYYKEEIIDDCFKYNQSFEDICQTLEGCFVSKEEIIAQLRQDKEKLMFREKGWDVKIADFIYNNLQSTQLFYDIGHPTNVVLREIANRILVWLNIDDTVSEEIDDALDPHEIPVYDCIRQYLGIQWHKPYLRERVSLVLGGVEMDMQEYVREYMWWCYGIDMFSVS